MVRTRLPKAIKRRERQWVFDLAKHEHGKFRTCYKLAKGRVLEKLGNQTRFRDVYLKKMHQQAFIARLRWATTEHGIPYDDFTRQLTRNNISVDNKMLQHLSIYEPISFKAIAEVAKSLNDYYGYQIDKLKRPEFIGKNGIPLNKDQIAKLRLITEPSVSDIVFKENSVNDCVDWARNQSNKKVRDIAAINELNSLAKETLNMSIDDDFNEGEFGNNVSLNELITISSKDHQELMQNINSEGENTVLNAMFDEKTEQTTNSGEKSTLNAMFKETTERTTNNSEKSTLNAMFEEKKESTNNNGENEGKS